MAFANGDYEYVPPRGFYTPFTPLRDEIATILQFWRNSIGLHERSERGSL
jgi:hypothetical protein